ncbi:MAG TPA: cytochrome P450 [Solirubrobacteraceae bacterium]
MSGLPTASLRESVQVLAGALLPSVARGLFSPRRRMLAWLTKADADARTVRLLGRLRSKHGGEGLRVLRGRMVVVWGRDALHEVLDHSATTYASDAGAKAKGMSHFQPDALTLSRGDAWRDRRAFAEHVLATGERVHPSGARFLAVVADEVDRLRIGDRLAWADWEKLWDRITLRVVFGDRARDEQALTGLLEQLMKEANRLAGLSPNDAYYELYGKLERHLIDPEPDTLVARIADAPQSDRTRIAQQIPHWMFAMRDTLGANAFRALAAITADPALERRVREELAGADLADPQAVAGLAVLQGAFHEAMRLWPTTPLLAREATADTTLAGEPVAEGTQVLIVNAFNHRDTAAVPDADRLVPERWHGDGERDYRFNHLANGTQWCPGEPLVLLLGQAVLARVLEEHALEPEDPSLTGGGPLPHMLDFYRLTLRASRREEARP